MKLWLTNACTNREQTCKKYVCQTRTFKSQSGCARTTAATVESRLKRSLIDYVSHWARAKKAQSPQAN